MHPVKQWYRLIVGFQSFRVLFIHSVVSDSLRSHGLQRSRPPCPSSTSGVYSNSCPLSQWCHPTISASVAPFSSCLQSFPASGSFPSQVASEWWLVKMCREQCCTLVVTVRIGCRGTCFSPAASCLMLPVTSRTICCYQSEGNNWYNLQGKIQAQITLVLSDLSG